MWFRVLVLEVKVFYRLEGIIEIDLGFKMKIVNYGV